MTVKKSERPEMRQGFCSTLLEFHQVESDESRRVKLLKHCDKEKKVLSFFILYSHVFLPVTRFPLTDQIAYSPLAITGQTKTCLISQTFKSEVGVHFPLRARQGWNVSLFYYFLKDNFAKRSLKSRLNGKNAGLKRQERGFESISNLLQN